MSSSTQERRVEAAANQSVQRALHDPSEPAVGNLVLVRVDGTSAGGNDARGNGFVLEAGCSASQEPSREVSCLALASVRF